MKKHLHYAIVFLLFLTASCVSEKIETEEDRISYNPEAVWEYKGDITVLNDVIKELKNSPNKEKLERRLLKNDVLWEESKFIFIDGKKRILIPFLSIDKENVIGVLSLVKNAEGKTTFDMTVRRDLANKTTQFPFWKRSVWAGYFMALDKEILGIKNGSPGLIEKLADENSKVKNKNSQTMRTVCGNIPVREICITYSECDSFDGGETWVNCVDLYEDCYYEYDWRCWEEPDNCPQGYEMDANGNCVPIVNQTCPTGYERDANGNCVLINQSCPSGYEMDANGNCVLINQCANAENEFDSSYGQSISKDISSIVTIIDNSNARTMNSSRKVDFKWQFYLGYGMNLFSNDSGIQNNVGNSWEWKSIKHDFINATVDNSLFAVSYTVNTISPIIEGPNIARITINFNVKSVLECGGIILKTKNENFTSFKVKSTHEDGDQ